MRKPHTFNPDSWQMPLKAGAQAAEACRIKIRPEGAKTRMWDADRHSPSPEMRREIKEWLIEESVKRFRMETMNGAGESIGSATYEYEYSSPEVPKMPPENRTEPKNPEELSAAVQMMREVGNTVSGVVRVVNESMTIMSANSESFAETIRKTRMEAPAFFVELYKDQGKALDSANQKREEAEKQRDALALLLRQSEKEKSGDKPSETTSSTVAALKEVKEIFSMAQPTIPQILQKMMDALKQGKTADLQELLRQQSDDDRAEIAAGVVLASLLATEPAKREAFQEAVKLKIMTKVAAAQQAA